MDLSSKLKQIAEDAKTASYLLASLDATSRTRLLHEMHTALTNAKEKILGANVKDYENAKNNGLSKPLLERLLLDSKRFDSMLKGISDVASQHDPLSEIIEKRQLTNGLELSKIRVPIGVVAIIYESRPNVTCEAASLCFKAGNTVILKGGSEARNTNKAICEAMQEPLKRVGLEHAICFVDSTDRQAVRDLVQLDNLIDLAIPRGGEGLIKSVMEWARVPVIKHAKGVCHTYVDKSADLEMALRICENAKCQRPSVCNAMETLLVHDAIAKTFLPLLVQQMAVRGVELRGNEKARAISPEMKEATLEDWSTEYLDLVLAVKVVSDLHQAIAHINNFGSRHSDAIITQDSESSARFLKEVDSAVVYVNASTRFTDGAAFGMGAEIGISTDKLHARGPMGAVELTTYKWLVVGDGQIRI